MCTVRTYLGLLHTIHTCNEIIYVPRLYGRVSIKFGLGLYMASNLYLALASNLSGLGLGLECGVLEPIPV
jgi:hypothetical protein